MFNVYGYFIACLHSLWLGFLPWLFSRVFRGLSLLLVRSQNDVNDMIFFNTNLERRRRTRFTTYATEARQWMARYEPLMELFGYTPVEFMEDTKSCFGRSSF
ncbi:hypothetical protein BC941DRAFT_511147 [Chlamydoabsidia padenii]|nr:hypothetical protein BC941DRAFT_511147 [Chlamydoabsidia padenii]